MRVPFFPSATKRFAPDAVRQHLELRNELPQWPRRAPHRAPIGHIDAKKLPPAALSSMCQMHDPLRGGIGKLQHGVFLILGRDTVTIHLHFSRAHE